MAMASKDSLKRMILQFRVSELQSLLAFAGEPIMYGKKKKDLQKKALNLITTKKIASLHNKIFSLYQNLNNKNHSSDDANDTPYFPTYKDKFRDFSKNFMNNWQSSYVTRDRGSGYFSDFADGLTDNECGSSRLVAMQKSYEKVTVDMDDIEFKNLPFFEFQKELSRVTALKPKKLDDDVFEFGGTFTLDSEWISRLESPYQIQIRICNLTNNITEVSDSLPLSLCVQVNDKCSSLPPPIPSTNRQGMLLRRMNVPINITSEVHRRSGVNKLMISWSIEDEELYAFTIHIVKKFTSDELIQKLKDKGERDPAITKKVIVDNLNDDEDEIAATSLKISLVCPLGKILIQLPVRATTCNHLQCFDGSLYIKMNDVKSTWQCPVCNSSCFYENLFIDGFFTNILKSDSFVDSVTEVEVDADANWSPVLPKKRKISDASSPPAVKKSLVVPASSPPPSQPEPPIVPEPLNEIEMEVVPPPPAPKTKKTEVDLVSDDDDSSNDVANDLQDFYHQYNKDAELFSYRAAFPSLPPFSEVNNHFLSTKADNCRDSRAAVPVIVSPSKNKSQKKNVIEVDLTLSDSDSGQDVRSLSESDDNSYDSDSSYTPSVVQGNSSGPPCYDIDDSDSDF
ncbi:E3 SUMO-protein ligase PIAS2-like [Planococcus citri]|uniref:E3 SUMO-protein ligase PIAS2-like n=1 Tax=Planococcus citri TaxID=170843 RepID=UPI0031F98FAA